MKAMHDTSKPRPPGYKDPLSSPQIATGRKSTPILLSIAEDEEGRRRLQETIEKFRRRHHGEEE
jgi:hypothetical protein